MTRIDPVGSALSCYILTRFEEVNRLRSQHYSRCCWAEAVLRSPGGTKTRVTFKRELDCNHSSKYFLTAIFTSLSSPAPSRRWKIQKLDSWQGLSKACYSSSHPFTHHAPLNYRQGETHTFTHTPSRPQPGSPLARSPVSLLAVERLLSGCLLAAPPVLTVLRAAAGMWAPH